VASVKLRSRERCVVVSGKKTQQRCLLLDPPSSRLTGGYRKRDANFLNAVVDDDGGVLDGVFAEGQVLLTMLRFLDF
jgi:hypothetical protein